MFMRVWLIIGVVHVMAMGSTASAQAEPLASPALEAAVTQTCLDWMKPLDTNAQLSLKRVDGGLCLNGHIETGDDKPVLDQLNSFGKTEPLVMVVRSGGGEVKAALAIGEALLDHPATVVADTFCASSCANFLITAGHRRVVRPDTLLLYHGGATLEQLEQALPQLRAFAAQDPQIMFNTYEDTLTTINRQEAFLTKAGISSTLFRWMDLINYMAPAEAGSHCPLDSVVVEYPPVVLARFGLTFDAYETPRSQTELDDLRHRLGKKITACLWRD